MEKDMVSIMIPCYNGEPFLDRLFHCILEQTYKKIQIIFADDGSKDGTKGLAEFWQTKCESAGMEFKYLYQENGGLASAINLALPHVLGEYCMWFDVDDLMTADHIEKKVGFLKEHPECDIVMCRGYLYDEGNLDVPIGTMGEERAISNLFEDILFERRRCTQGLYMVRTDVLMRVLPQKHIYDENRRMGQNMQLLLPITLQNHIGYIENKLFRYVVRSSSLSHASGQNPEKLLAYAEHVYDIKEHVLNTLPISKPYLRFLMKKLELFLCCQKISILSKSKEFEDERYVKTVAMNYVNYSDIKRNQKNRNIVYWGKCECTENIALCLERYTGIRGTAYIDSDARKCNGQDVLYKDSIVKESMYLVIPLEYHQDIVNLLEERGFESHKDFFYPKYDLCSKFDDQDKE